VLLEYLSDRQFLKKCPIPYGLRRSVKAIESSLYQISIPFFFGLVGKPEGKRPLGRPRRRWIDNIKMDLLEIGLNVVDWIGLDQDRYRWRALVNSVMNLRVP
jgi:hypothetical protein